MSSNRTLRLNIIANYAGKGWEALMGFVFLPLYIAYLGPAAYGIVGFLALIQGWMALLDLGLTPTLTREMARAGTDGLMKQQAKDLLRSVEIITYTLATLIWGAIALSTGFLATEWLNNQMLPTAEISSALSIGAFVIALRFCETIYRGSLSGLQRQVTLNAITAAMATVRGGGAVLILAFVNQSLFSFFAWQAFVSVATILCFGFAVYRALGPSNRRPRFSRQALGDIKGFATGVFSTSLLAILVTQIDKLYLSRAVSLESFGYYVFAAKVATIIGAVAAPIIAALYPHLVATVSRGDDVKERQLFHLWSSRVSAITAPIAAVLSLFGREVVFVWSGNLELAAKTGPLLGALALGSFIHMQAMIPYQVQLAHGWTKLGVWSNIMVLLVISPWLLWTVPSFGSVGAAYVWIAVASTYLLTTAAIMFRRLLQGERWRWLAFDVGLPAFCAFGSVWLMLVLFDSSGLGRWGILAFGTLLGTVGVLATLLAQKIKLPLA